MNKKEKYPAVKSGSGKEAMRKVLWVGHSCLREPEDLGRAHGRGAGWVFNVFQMLMVEGFVEGTAKLGSG